ncbi:MAG TPA: hypothetical protein VNA13_03960 [Xanthomonadales bacterium]|nr:hypothetical protein [Xanthomonadales bacterium]
MKKIFDHLHSVLPYLLVFIGSLHTPSDPDLGWHLKYGEYFFKTGHILRDNTFSTLMPDYKWANTSWGADLITYLTFNMGGFFALSILGAVVVTLTFYFFAKAAKLNTWDQVFLFPLLLFLQNPINSVSFRGQQISLLLLGILFYLLSLYDKKPNFIYFVIPLFFVWVNLHGQFILGLILLAGWIAAYCMQQLIIDIDKKNIINSLKDSLTDKKREFGTLILVIILSVISTLINPFGMGVHQDAISHIGSPLLKSISEYLPFQSLSQAWWNQVIVAILLFVGLLFFIFRGEFFKKIPFLASVLLLYILSFSVRRFAWPAYYLILPLLQPIPGLFKPDSKKITKISASVMLSVLIIINVSGKLPLNNFQKFNWNNYCNSQNMLCSPKSAEFLKEHELTDNLYSLYGWGGYLLWNHPEIKPTIDGRMHMWRDENGNSGFEEYYAVEQNIQDIDKTKYDTAYISSSKPVYRRLLELTNEGKWKVVYQDKNAGIFVRN